MLLHFNGSPGLIHTDSGIDLSAEPNVDYTKFPLSEMQERGVFGETKRPDVLELERRLLPDEGLPSRLERIRPNE